MVAQICPCGSHSDHYGFVTFYNTEDAFAAIDNGGKIRRPDELPFDICFGGRRQFCDSDYADLGESRKPGTVTVTIVPQPHSSSSMNPMITSVWH